MAAAPAAEMAKKYPGVIVGIKTAHYAGPEWTPVENAVQAGTTANIPVMVDFGNDKPERPVAELQRIHRMHERLFGETPEDEWIEVDDELGAELQERLAKLSHDGPQALETWASVENLEERIGDDMTRIDPVVLEHLRKLTA